MRKKSFLYYGYDRNTYKSCLDLISSTNHKHVFINNSWFVANNFLFLVFSYMNIFGVSRSRIPFYVAFLAVAAVFEVILVVFRKQCERYSAVTVYLSVCMLMIYGIMTSVSQPYMAATIFLVLLVVIALSYIDQMARMTIILLAFSTVFLTSSYSQKAISIAYYDTYNAVIVMILAVALHYTFQHTRMDQFVLYQKNLSIQRELEVKSSFDALTSLLNRGRFFAIAEEVIRQKTDEYIVICLLDLDSFKQINDQLGHQMGDKAIQIAGTTILDTLNIDQSEKWSFPERAMSEKLSFAGRLGGDEFIALIRGKGTKEEIIALLQEMLTSLNGVKIDQLNGIHASFGVTELLPTDRDFDSVYKRADDALYESKRSGKNQIRFAENL